MFDFNKMPDAPWEPLKAFARRVGMEDQMGTLQNMCRSGEISTLPRKSHKAQYRVNLVKEYEKCAQREF